MFEEILHPQTKKLLKSFTSSHFPENSYLGGGTAVALHLGHRKSADLDFFTSEEFVETQWEQKMADELGLKLIKKDWQTLIGTIGDVKISLMGYKYKLIGKLKSLYNVKIASVEDLAAMKLDTIIARGTKRDFVDIYFLVNKFGLSGLFDLYDKKYGNWDEREIMVKKALVYFEEADKDEMPDMLASIEWEEIKKWFVEKVLKDN